MFREEIKNLRLSCLLSQNEFAEALGVSFAAVNRWENGKSCPNLKTMKAIKKFCEKKNYPYGAIASSWMELRK